MTEPMKCRVQDYLIPVIDHFIIFLTEKLLMRHKDNITRAIFISMKVIVAVVIDTIV